MKYILYFMMMIYGSLCHAIVCKHIVEISETNTRKVHQIRRDALGYMWFMSHTGISRFDGTKLKHYKLSVCRRTDCGLLYGLLPAAYGQREWVMGGYPKRRFMDV